MHLGGADFFTSLLLRLPFIGLGLTLLLLLDLFFAHGLTLCPRQG